MLKSQCSICTELFDGVSDVSAVPCGHTFHDVCLSKWLEQSMTCPQCRKRVTQRNVIHKLYFDQAELTQSEECPNQLKNALDTAKVSLKQKDRERQELVTEKAALQERVEGLRESLSNVELIHKQEIANSKALRRELHFHKTLQKDAEAAKEETKQLRKKLGRLENVEKVINGSDEQIHQMVQSQGDPKQLATWCTVIQRELATKRQDNKILRDQVEKLRRELNQKKKALAEQTEAVAKGREQVRVLEEDLHSSEGELAKSRKRLEALQKALGSPRDSATSFAHRLINESPMPAADSSRKRPRLSPSGSDVDLDMTPDLFSPERSPVVSDRLGPSSPPKPSPSTQTKADCQEYGTQFIKINSLAKTLGKKRDLKDVSNVPNLPGLSTYNIMRKSSSAPSVIKQGYNGLGGHTKHVQPLGKNLSIFKKPAKPGPQLGKVLKPNPFKSIPKLPTLDLDL